MQAQTITEPNLSLTGGWKQPSASWNTAGIWTKFESNVLIFNAVLV